MTNVLSLRYCKTSEKNLVKSLLCIERKLPFNILKSCLSNVSKAATSLHCFDRFPTAATVALRRISLFDAR